MNVTARMIRSIENNKILHEGDNAKFTRSLLKWLRVLGEHGLDKVEEGVNVELQGVMTALYLCSGEVDLSTRFLVRVVMEMVVEFTEGMKERERRGEEKGKGH